MLEQGLRAPEDPQDIRANLAIGSNLRPSPWLSLVCKVRKPSATFELDERCEERVMKFRNFIH